MVYEYILLISVFFLGACVGSFMDVIRVRGSWQKSLTGRSMCAKCQYTLRWYELIPILSYIVLIGRCSHCRQYIPALHTVSEVLMGVLFVFAFSETLWITATILLAAVFLIPIVIADGETMEVPEHLSFPFTIIALGFAVLSVIMTANGISLVNGVLLAAPFFLIWLFSSGRAMGLGDAKVALPLGFLLTSIMDVISVFIFSFWIGALGVLFYTLCILLMTGSLPSLKQRRIPFVPCIAVAFFFVIYTGTTFTDIAMILQHAFMAMV